MQHPNTFSAVSNPLKLRIQHFWPGWSLPLVSSTSSIVSFPDSRTFSHLLPGYRSKEDIKNWEYSIQFKAKKKVSLSIFKSHIKNEIAKKREKIPLKIAIQGNQWWVSREPLL